MRIFIVLMLMTFVSALSFFSSADDSGGVSFPQARAEREAGNFRCVKRVAIGNETACLMQKRKGRA
ncbi:hypothetical protein [Methylocystis parvus]|uniref:Uncharacterized protein n=1 Tax=Methylocystis parvus TaxID=134 RepID=A0A6B8M3J0_9HYPH|nr:hypothetical protein [Methylocystis parvus]QGM96309.1 hypothetical protein F7D14_01620 [Methylocystis parvus]WBJ99852.1 hypothetical protein MMG94_18005 [Methylocystis parvus OBBP]